MAYSCPYAVRNPRRKILLCRPMMTEGVDYADMRNVAKAYCVHQRLCERAHEMVNDDDALACYERKKAKSKY